MLEDVGGAALRATIPRLPRHGESATFPLSFAQQRLWFLDQLEPSSPLYDIFTAWRLRGTLIVEAVCPRQHHIRVVSRARDTFRKAASAKPV